MIRRFRTKSRKSRCKASRLAPDCATRDSKEYLRRPTFSPPGFKRIIMHSALMENEWLTRTFLQAWMPLEWEALHALEFKLEWEALHRNRARRIHSGHGSGDPVPIPGSTTRADQLNLMEDLLRFDREQSKLRLYSQLHSGESFVYPVVLRFKYLLQAVIWNDVFSLSSINRANPVACLFELFMENVNPLEISVQPIYQMLYGSVLPVYSGKANLRSSYQQQLTLIVFHCLLNPCTIPSTLYSFWQPRCVHFYYHAIKKFPAIHNQEMQSKRSVEGKPAFLIRPTMNGIQFLHEVLLISDIIKLYSYGFDESQCALNALLVYTKEYLEAARPIYGENKEALTKLRVDESFFPRPRKHVQE